MQTSRAISPKAGVQDGVGVMNKPETNSSGASRKSSHAKGRRRRKTSQNITEDARELQTLQQAFHRLTKARRAEERKAQETIRKQSKLIGSLSARKQDLQAQLEGVEHALDAGEHLNQSFSALHHRSAFLDECIIREKQTISGLQKEIREMHRKIDTERRTAALEANPTSRIQQLTRQLAQVNKRFSSLISINTQLRNDIETMKAEKVKFLQMRSKLKQALQETHLQKGRVLQQASQSALVREETRVRMLRVKEQASSEEGSHAVEVQELKRQLSHMEKSEQFLQEKNKARHPDLNHCLTIGKQEAHRQEPQVDRQAKLKEYEIALEKISDIIQGRERASGGQQKNSDHLTDTGMEPPQCTFEKSASRRRSTLVGPMFREAAAGSWVEVDGVRRGRRLTEHRRRSELLPSLKQEEQERLRQLSFTVLQQNFQQPAVLNPQLLYDSYMEGENLNFSLFTYISEQNRQIEEVTKDLDELRMSMEQEEKRWSAEEGHLKNRVRELQLNCQQTTQTAETTNKDVEEKERILRQLAAENGLYVIGELVLVPLPQTLFQFPTYLSCSATTPKATSSVFSILQSSSAEPRKLKWKSDPLSLTFSPCVESLAVQAGMDVSLFELRRPWTEDSGTKAMLALLGQIEQRVTLFYHTQFRGSKGGKLDFASVVLKEPNPRTLPDTDIQPPATSIFPESEEEYENEDLKPLSREELQKRALEMVVLLHAKSESYDHSSK